MNRSGITLIELLVYIGVTSIFLLAVSGVLYSLLATSHQTDVLRDQRVERSLFAERIGMLVEQSYGSDPGSSFGIDIAQNQGSVTFRMRDAASDPAELFIQDGVAKIRYGTGAVTILSAEQHAVVHFIVDNRSSETDSSFTFTITTRSLVGYGLPSAEQTTHVSYTSLDYAP